MNIFIYLYIYICRVLYILKLESDFTYQFYAFRKEINYFILKLNTKTTLTYIYLSKITKFSVLLNARVSSNNQYATFFLILLFSNVKL